MSGVMAFRCSAASLIAAGLILTASAVPALADAAVGAPAPALTLPELTGKVFNLAALKGHTVIVNFWATWCGPCRQEMPRLNAFYRQHRTQGLVLIGVSTDRAGDRQDVRKVMDAYDYPVAMLSDATANGFGRIAELPTTYVIAADGVVRAKLVPDSEAGISEKQLAGAVLPLLRHEASATPTSTK
jgi:cytochrome c biogenesis protein CcmG, thiol:disulfide interchange protein DsbE